MVLHVVAPALEQREALRQQQAPRLQRQVHLKRSTRQKTQGDERQTRRCCVCAEWCCARPAWSKVGAIWRVRRRPRATCTPDLAGASIRRAIAGIGGPHCMREAKATRLQVLLAQRLAEVEHEAVEARELVGHHALRGVEQEEGGVIRMGARARGGARLAADATRRDQGLTSQPIWCRKSRRSWSSLCLRAPIATRSQRWCSLPGHRCAAVLRNGAAPSDGAPVALLLQRLEPAPGGRAVVGVELGDLCARTGRRARSAFRRSAPAREQRQRAVLSPLYSANALDSSAYSCCCEAACCCADAASRAPAATAPWAAAGW